MALLWRTPLTAAATRYYSPHKHIFYYPKVVIYLWRKEERGPGILHIEIMALSGIPAAYIFLGRNNKAVQSLLEVVAGCSPGKAMQVSMEYGLLEDTMFPEYHRSVVLGKEVLDFAFQCK